MAKDTIEIPATQLQALMARLDKLEHEARIQAEIVQNSKANVLDPTFEAWKKEVARPAQERSQDLADKVYGKDGKRFRVYLDSSTDDGKPGPNISEHPVLVISANSDLEAGARYLQHCGITRHAYKIRAEQVSAA